MLLRKRCRLFRHATSGATHKHWRRKDFFQGIAQKDFSRGARSLLETKKTTFLPNFTVIEKCQISKSRGPWSPLPTPVHTGNRCKIHILKSGYYERSVATRSHTQKSVGTPFPRVPAPPHPWLHVCLTFNCCLACLSNLSNCTGIALLQSVYHCHEPSIGVGGQKISGTTVFCPKTHEYVHSQRVDFQ